MSLGELLFLFFILFIIVFVAVRLAISPLITACEIDKKDIDESGLSKLIEINYFTYFQKYTMLSLDL